MNGHPYTSHVSLTDARRDALADAADLIANGGEMHWSRRVEVVNALRAVVSLHDEAASRAEFRRRRDHDLEVAQAIASEEWAAWEDDRLMEVE